MNESAGTQQSTTSGRAIPFRQDSGAIADSAMGVFLVLVLLLATLLGLLMLAKRKGWLRRWSVEPASAASMAGRLRVEQTLRLSQRTSLYRIADGQARFLVLESASGAIVVPSDPSPIRVEGDAHES